MAVPTITSVSPTRGPTAGATICEIAGTNFRVPSQFPGGVRVFFGTTEAALVRVASATRLVVTAPKHDPGTVTITVRNAGPFNEQIGSESATLADAFTFARPVLTTDIDSDYARVVRVLIRLFRREVIDEVVYSEHLDWSREPSAIPRVVGIAKTPALVLNGPQLRENKVYRTAAPYLVDAPVEAHKDTRRPARTLDLVFTLVGVCGASEGSGILHNLMAATTACMEANNYLYLDRDPADARKGQVRYDFGFDADFAVDPAPNQSGVAAFSGQIAVYGFDLESFAGFAGDGALRRDAELGDEVELQSTRVD